jgi:broad specificity phosphatase PhoE
MSPTELAPSAPSVDAARCRSARAGRQAVRRPLVTGRTFELWVVRHGETEWARLGRHTGRTDIPLTAEGERQARAVGALLAGRGFAAVLTSPLRRAQDTCRLAGYGDVARVEPDLAEWDYGDYEGRRSADVREELPGWTVWTGELPHGETIDEVAARARRVLAAAEAAGGDVLLFAHGHVLRILSALWLGLPPRGGQLLALSPGALSVLGFESGARVLRLWNREA